MGVTVRVMAFLRGTGFRLGEALSEVLFEHLGVGLIRADL